MKKILLCMAIALSLPTLCMAKKTLVLMGDASMAQHSIANPDVSGWGEELEKCFTKNVEVRNFAQAGESARTLINKRLDKIIEQCASGDYVILQVGQNDLREEYGSMYSSTADLVDQLSAVVEKLKDNKMKVILCTPIAHPFYVDDKVVNRYGGYVDVIRRVAQLKKVDLIDLYQLTEDWLNNMGKDNAQLFYKQVSNNTTPREYLLTETGAVEVSRMVAKEIVAQKIPYLSKQMLHTNVH